jgi:hypothetical protein
MVVDVIQACAHTDCGTLRATISTVALRSCVLASSYFSQFRLYGVCYQYLLEASEVSNSIQCSC